MGETTSMETSFLHTIIFKTGIVHLYWGHVAMWFIGFAFIYLAIKKEFEPLLLVPIGFGIFIDVSGIMD